MRKKKATAMATATKTEFLGSSSSSQSPTKPSTPTNSAPPLSQRLQNDTCFSCRNKGHWAANCPFKTPPSQPPSQSPSQKACRFSSSPSPSSVDTSFVSPIPCPNGHGPCSVRISRSAKNPDRPFYSCSKVSLSLPLYLFLLFSGYWVFFFLHSDFWVFFLFFFIFISR